MNTTLSIVIPVFNESSYIIRCLENVLQTPTPNWKKQIIVVDDGSTDGTMALLQNFTEQFPGIKVLLNSSNEGKGAALRKGVQHATGEVVIVQDADLEYDPSDYNSILAEYKDDSTKVVYGSRILGAKIYHNYSANAIFLMGGVLLTKLVNLLFGTKITDQPTCYKSWKNTVSKKLLEYCEGSGFDFEVEMTAFFSQLGTIKEVPIHYYPRTVSHGKKIRLSDFISSVIMIFRCRFFRSSHS